MLRFWLLRWFGAIVILFGVLSAVLGIRMIASRTVAEAQTRVRLDLNSAWSVYQSNLRDIETILRLTGSRNLMVDALAAQEAGTAPDWVALQAALGKEMIGFNLDFLTVVDPTGRALLRVAPPHATGDARTTCPLLARALAGEACSGTVIYTRDELTREAGNLADRAFFQLQETPRARLTPRTTEDRGMVMMAAAPVEKNGRVLGAVYAGVLLNRRHQFVDRVQDIVFEKESYNGVPVGTVTVFLGDSRIATTVHLDNGNRAYGTRVSKEVADRVLDNGQSWVGRAFVVRDWYLTAYDPIRDSRGEVVGMLYVGILERPFRDLSRSIILRYSALSAVGLVAALLVAFAIAGKLARPLHRLSEASNRMRHGQPCEPLPADASCEEVNNLTGAFNEMTRALSEREGQLKAANRELEHLNDSLTRLNTDYMETLQFVSHEMKSPISSVVNYVYLLREGKLGELTPKQAEALQRVDDSIRRLTEMIRHYLNLARIENQELRPIPTRVLLEEEVIRPTLRSLESEIQARRMQVEDHIGAQVALRADLNMVRELFENLLSNAVKYGREGGRITLRCEAAGAKVACFVANEGAGITPENLGRVFQKFSHIVTGAHRHTHGTGLGLFISRKIAEAHGGSLDVTSKPGEWTEFRCMLPGVPPGAQKTGGGTGGESEAAG